MKGINPKAEGEDPKNKRERHRNKKFKFEVHPLYCSRQSDCYGESA